MNARELAMYAYYYSTLAFRKRYRRRVEAEGNAPLCVLFYHRVSDSHPNPWSIGNDEFRRQMMWLRENVDLVSLEEIQRRMRSGVNDRLAVAVTFDDGYAENCEHAIPFLIENEIPTTYFVALDYVVRSRPFPHDVERGIPLAPNTIDEIRWMSDAGIEIGAHTRTHCNVGAINQAGKMVDEVVTATAELADLVGRPIRYFAFPFGQTCNLSAAAAFLAKQHGIQGVCSAYGAYNYVGNDAFHIQRLHADPELIRLKNWVTLDPRKRNLGIGFELPETAVTTKGIQSHLDQSHLIPDVRDQESPIPTLPVADSGPSCSF